MFSQLPDHLLFRIGAYFDAADLYAAMRASATLHRALEPHCARFTLPGSVGTPLGRMVESQHDAYTCHARNEIRQSSPHRAMLFRCICSRRMAERRRKRLRLR